MVQRSKRAGNRNPTETGPHGWLLEGSGIRAKAGKLHSRSEAGTARVRVAGEVQHCGPCSKHGEQRRSAPLG